MNKELIQKLINQIAQNKKDIAQLKRRLPEEKVYNSYQYFKDVTEEEKDYFLKKFCIGKDDLEKAFEEAYNWLKMNNKRKTDYKAFMCNWILKKHRRLTDEEIKKNEERLKKVQAMIKNKLNK